MSRSSSVDDKCLKTSQSKKTSLSKKRPQESNNRGYRDWFNRNMTDRQSEVEFESYWQTGHGQKLFPAMSDPAVCGYSMPFGYPFDQVAFPVYPVIPATPVARPFKPAMIHSYSEIQRHPKRPETASLNHKESQYTSLPPGTGADCGSDQRRRFSDPGLANAQNEDSCSTSSSNDNDREVLDQMNKLVTENQRLTKEISSTREEVRALKLEINQLMDTQSAYPPGSIIDMVKEIELALGIRQEAMMSKTQQYIKDILGSSVLHKSDNAENIPTKEEFDNMKKQLSEVIRDRDELQTKLQDLESRMESFMNESRTKESSQNSRLLSLEQEELKLRKQLQEVLNGQRTRAIARISSSIVGSEEKEKHDSNHILTSMDNCESLTSSLSSDSHHSSIVNMSGPVTDV